MEKTETETKEQQVEKRGHTPRIFNLVKLPPLSKNLLKWASFQNPFGVLNVAKEMTEKLKWGPDLSYVKELPKNGIFMTGIESSDPWVENGRRNQLKEAHDFYLNFEDRLKKIHDLGIQWLRFGPPYSQTHVARDTFDFSFMDKVVEKCKELNITIIADLLHFGLPEWLHEQNAEEPFFQNEKFPEEFARYAGVFARRYPDIQYYTVVNEPFVTAHFSSKLGIWNEMRSGVGKDDRAFVKAVANIARAAILGREEIEKVFAGEKRKVKPIYVQNESFEKAFAEPGSGREEEVGVFNLRRFAALDLITGHRNKAMQEYLKSQGLMQESYDWFMERGCKERVILGIDHYPWCVHTYHADCVVDHTAQDRYYLYDLVKEYHDRYKLPFIHTEINAWPDYAGGMVLQTYDALSRLRREGVPIFGMTWYGDEYQVGWHSGLVGEKAFEETPVGLYYKGQSQPVAELFKALAQHGFVPLPEKKTFRFPFTLSLQKYFKMFR